MDPENTEAEKETLEFLQDKYPSWFQDGEKLYGMVWNEKKQCWEQPTKFKCWEQPTKFICDKGLNHWLCVITVVFISALTILPFLVVEGMNVSFAIVIVCSILLLYLVICHYFEG